MSGFRFNNGTGRIEFNDTEIVDGNIPASAYVLSNGSAGSQMQRGTTAQRPGSPQSGMVRYNTDTDQYEGYFAGATNDWVNLPNANEIVISSTNLIRVSPDVITGQFTSIAGAVDSITTASDSNPFVVMVEPGVYTEPEIVLKPGITLVSRGGELATFIIAANPLTNIITAANGCWIQGFTLSNALGSGACGIYFKSSSSATTGTLRLHSMRFLGNETDFLVESDTFPSYVIAHELHFVTTNNATKNHLVLNSGIAPVRMLSFSMDIIYISGTGLQQGILVKGPTSEFNADGITMIALGANSTGDGVAVQDGGIARIVSLTVSGFNNNIVSYNVGAPPVVQLLACVSTLSSTLDLNIAHPGTTGMFVGATDATKTFIDNASSLAANYTDVTNKKQVLVGSISVGNTQGTITDVTDLIQESSAVGLLFGGLLSSTATPLQLAVTAGYGYISDSITSKATRVSWSDTTLMIPDDSNVYIYVTAMGTIEYDISPPNIDTTILLGRMRTSGGHIVTFVLIPRKSVHLASHVDTFLRDVLGTVYVSGSLVAENALTPRGIDVTSGEYWYSTLPFYPTGGASISFRTFYHVGGTFIQGVDSTIVDNTQYDDGTSLQPISAGKFVKHSLTVVGDGDNEIYALVYGRDQWDTLQDAQTAALPTRPTIFTDIATAIAAIIVQEGNPHFVEVIDIRPRIGFQSPAVSVVTKHGDLSGLLNNDHPQYLLRTGTSAMQGDLSLGSNNITNVNQVNGVVVQTHGARHMPNGADPIVTAAPTTALSPASVNGVGVQNSLARSDHSHAITGFQPLDDDLTALAAISTTGLYTITAAGTASTRSIVPPAAGIAVTNGSGVAGNPTLSLTNDLAAVEGIGTNGIAVRTATDTWTTRSVAGTIGRVSVTNGDGLSSNPTIDLSSGVIGTPGTYFQTTIDTYGRVTAGTNPTTLAGFGITDAAPLPATYITVSNDGILPNERSLAGTTNQITVTDGGANASIAVAISNDPVLPGTSQVIVPTGTTGQEVGVTNGAIRYNTTTDTLRQHSAGAWRNVGTVTSVDLIAPVAGIAVVGSPITSSGSLTLALADDLAAIESLNTNGIFTRTNTNVWAARSVVGPAAGVTVTNGDGIAGNPTISLSNDLAAVEGMATTGLTARTATDTWTTRSLTAPAAGFTITNPAGIAGNPTFVLANDLGAIEGLSSNGVAVRTATDTWTTRAVTGTAGNITVANGDGIAGNPTVDLVATGTAGTYRSVTTDTYGRVTAGTNPTTLAGYGITDAQPLDSDLTALANTATTGLYVVTGTGTSVTRSLTAPAAGLTITDPAGIAGNPTFALANDLAAIEALNTNGILARTATDTWAARSITGTANQITLVNGDGIAGAPTISITSNPIIPGTTSITIPTGTTAQRPGSPTLGMIRFNSTENLVEGYVNPYSLFATPTAIQYATSMYTKRVTWEDDFLTGTSVGDAVLALYGELNWSSTSPAGTSTNAFQPAVTNHPGILRLTTGITGGNSVTLHLSATPTGAVIVANQVEYIAWVVRVPTVSLMDFHAGIGQDISNITSYGTDGVFFSYGSAVAGGAWQFITRAGGVSTTITTTSGAVTANTWYLLEAFYDGTTWTPVVNGVVNTGSTTNIPAVALNVGCMVTTNTGAARSVDVDMFSLMTREMGARF